MWVAFGLGVFLGTFLGVLIAGLLVMAKSSDGYLPDIPERGKNEV